MTARIATDGKYGPRSFGRAAWSLFVATVLILAPIASVAEGPILVRLGDDGDRPDSVRVVAVSADGRLVALAGEPETPVPALDVQIRDARSGRLLHTLGGHELPVRGVAFSPDGVFVATVASDADGVGLLRLFETATGRLAHTVDAGGRVVRFLPDGRVAVAGYGRVLAFDPRTGREVGRFPAMPVVKDLSADGRRAVGVSHHGRAVLEVRDLGTGRAVAELAGSLGEPLAAAFSPDARVVAAVDPRGKALLFWEVLTGRSIRRVPLDSAVLTIAFTADGRHLLAGGLDRLIRVWEVASGAETGRLTGHDGAVTALAAGPTGAITVSGSTDRTAIVWSASRVRGTALPTGPLGEAEFESAWQSLAAPDAGPAWRTLGLLAARPADVLPGLARRVESQLAPVPDADVARLLAALDHPDYRERERATAELAAAGETVRAHLERAAGTTASPEVRARLRILLRRMGSTPRFSPGDVLRLRRLIGGLKASDDPAAERTLRLIAESFPDPTVAAEARAVLERKP